MMTIAAYWEERALKAEAEVERLTAEVEDWKERWGAERRDHEATIRNCEYLLNGGPCDKP